jgi:hypothetical protein
MSLSLSLCHNMITLHFLPLTQHQQQRRYEKCPPHTLKISNELLLHVTISFLNFIRKFIFIFIVIGCHCCCAASRVQLVSQLSGFTALPSTFNPHTLDDSSRCVELYWLRLSSLHNSRCRSAVGGKSSQAREDETQNVKTGFRNVQIPRSLVRLQ